MTTMDLKPDQEKVRVLLIDTISLLCRSGLSFDQNVVIQGVIGITVDRSEVFLVHINQELSSSDDVECIDVSADGTPSHIIQQQFKDKPYQNKLRIKISNSKAEVCRDSSAYSNSWEESTQHYKPPVTYQPSYDSPVVSTVNNSNNGSLLYSPGSRIKKEPGYPAAVGSMFQDGSDANDMGSNHRLRSNPNEHTPNILLPFKQDFDSADFPEGFNAVRGTLSTRRASRRRGGRRGGVIGNRPMVKPDGSIDGSSWETMVATSFICKVCGQSFVHKSNLLGHQIRIHGRQKNKRGRPPSNNNQSNITSPQATTTTPGNFVNGSSSTYHSFPSEENIFDPSTFNTSHYPSERRLTVEDEPREDGGQMNITQPEPQPHFDYGGGFHHNGMTNQNYPDTSRW